MASSRTASARSFASASIPSASARAGAGAIVPSTTERTDAGRTARAVSDDSAEMTATYLDAPRFAMTYGDGIGAVDLTAALAAHTASGKLGTLTGVHPSGRYGEMQVDGDDVVEFNEKPTTATDPTPSM